MFAINVGGADKLSSALPAFFKISESATDAYGVLSRFWHGEAAVQTGLDDNCLSPPAK